MDVAFPNTDFHGVISATRQLPLTHLTQVVEREFYVAFTTDGDRDRARHRRLMQQERHIPGGRSPSGQRASCRQG